MTEFLTAARLGVRAETARKPVSTAQAPPEGLATTCLATIPPRPIRWLVPGYFPLGKLVLMAGDGGLGKSLLTLDLAAAVSRGRAAFGLGYSPAEPAEVLLVCCEDDFTDTVVPRLLAAAADLQRIHRVDGIRGPDGHLLPFSLAYYHQVEQELQRRPGIRLVVIDPAAAYVGRGGRAARSNSELRALLDPLAELAARRQVTVLMVAHCNKAPTAKAVHKVLDSVGWVNTVRAAYLVVADPDDDSRVLLLHLKGNLGTRPPGLVYRLHRPEPRQRADLLGLLAHLSPADQEDLLRQMVKMEWLGETSRTADEVTCPREQQRAAEAAKWLVEFLTPYAYPSKEVFAAGAQGGYSCKELHAARKRLKGQVRVKKEGAFQGAWWWGLGASESWTFRPDSAAIQVESESRSRGTTRTAKGSPSAARLPTSWQDILASDKPWDSLDSLDSLGSG
jgi:putative DNA primase/helicase